MSDTVRAAVYGFPLLDVADVPGGAMQVSPLVAGSTDLAELPEGALDAIVVQAPAGAAERRYVLALALRALKTEGRLTALALKDRGGQRLNKELTAFGCTIGESAKRHQRICVTLKPANVTGLEAAIAEGAPRRLDGDGLWTQPGGAQGGHGQSAQQARFASRFASQVQRPAPNRSISDEKVVQEA